MREVFLKNFYIAEENIYTLIDHDATIDRIKEIVATIRTRAQSGDRIILYFATHGKSMYESPCLAAYEAENSDKDTTNGWINTMTLLGTFHSMQCNVVAFLDCCQSTLFFASRGTDFDFSGKTSLNTIKDQYIIAFSAAGVDEEAYPDLEYNHGCWTHYLAMALSGLVPEAFSGGSSRITAYSLQAYLKPIVLARVRSLFNKRQTPYQWGTFSEDVTLVEIPEQEAKSMRIKDIYFGEVDADSEPSSSIEKNFYDLNSISKEIYDNNNIKVIIGNKGTGKIYIGEYLQIKNRTMLYQSVGAITLSEISAVTLTQKNEKGKYVDAWKYTIYTLLICSIVKNKRTGDEAFSLLLKQIYGEKADLLLVNPLLRRKFMYDKALKNNIRLDQKYGIYAISNGTVPISNLIMLYEDLLNNYYESESLCFIIDGLDDQIRGEIREDQKAFLLDLLAMVDQSNKAMKRVRIILLFRNDILRLIDGEANLNKISTARTCKLSWLSFDGKQENTSLYQLIEKRLATSKQVLNIINGPMLCNILPPTVNGPKTWDWILDLTRYIPRDIISFFNECKVLAREQSCITESNMWDATRPYSEYLWQEFKDVLSGTCLANYGDSLITLFTNLADTYNIYGNTTIFTYVDFQKAYNDIEAFNQVAISSALKVLYESGIMCVHTKDKRTYWYYRENPIEFNPIKWVESSFEIHKGLWKKVHIW
jgi:hypothetical protein